MNEIAKIIIAVLFWIARSIFLLPLIIGISKYKSFTSQLKLITIHLVFVTIISITMSVLSFLIINNRFLAHILAIEEFTMIMLFYRAATKKLLLEKEKYKPRKIFIPLIILFAVFAIINALFLQDITKTPTYTKTVEIIIIIFFSLFHFYKQADEPIPKIWSDVRIFRLNKISFFWIVTGILLYFSCSLILFSSYNLLLNPNVYEIATSVWLIHAILNIIFYSFIAIGLWRYKKKDVSDYSFD